MAKATQNADGYYADFVAFLRARNKIKGETFRNEFVSYMLRDADAGLMPTFRDWPHLLEWVQRDGEVHSSTIDAARALWHRWHNRWLAKLRADLGELY